MFKLLSLTIFAIYTTTTAAGQVGGYHYEKPSVGQLYLPPTSGHSFGPLPTIAPLPAVPALPPLPTARTKGQVFNQALYQTHPIAINAIQNTYIPPTGAGIGRIAQQYQSSSGQQAPPSAPGPSAPAPFSFPSSGLGNTIGSNIPNPPPAGAQPLRIPFGKQAVVNYPTTGFSEQSSYESNGRQLKQYAVIEIIDNDIEQNSQPFLTTPFIDSYRAHIGASGTGAAPAPLGGVQIQSRANALVAEQQQQQQRSSSATSNDSVALGSGGLGFIRLANGNVYLGSGSLGYISGQQHTQSINEARTRTGAPQPDALHFGHGALGAGTGASRFFYRFK